MQISPSSLLSDILPGEIYFITLIVQIIEIHATLYIKKGMIYMWHSRCCWVPMTLNLWFLETRATAFAEMSSIQNQSPPFGYTKQDLRFHQFAPKTVFIVTPQLMISKNQISLAQRLLQLCATSHIYMMIVLGFKISGSVYPDIQHKIPISSYMQNVSLWPKTFFFLE